MRAGALLLGLSGLLVSVTGCCSAETQGVTPPPVLPPGRPTDPRPELDQPAWRYGGTTPGEDPTLPEGWVLMPVQDVDLLLVGLGEALTYVEALVRAGRWRTADGQ